MIGHIWVVRSGFVDFDDPLIFLDRRDLQVSFDVFVSNAFDWERSDTWRPIRDLSHWVDFAIHGQSALGAHVHNLLLLGLLTTLACTYFVRLGFRKSWIYFAVAVALLHPAQIEVIAWVSGRKDLLAAIFFFGSLLLFQKFMSARQPIGYGLAILLLFVLGIMSKGHIIVLSIVLLCAHKLECTVEQTRRIAHGRLFSLVIILLALGLAFAWRIADGGASLPPELANTQRYGLTLSDRLQLPLRYLGTILFPTDLNHIYLTRMPDMSYHVLTVASVIVSTGFLLTTVLFWRRGDPRGPLMATSIVLMMPYLHFRPGVVYMADRYLFIPMFFLVVTGIYSIVRITRIRQTQRKHLIGWGSSLIGLLLVLGIRPHAAFVDSTALWSRMTEVYPQSPWGYDRLGQALFEREFYGAASGAWLKAATLDPRDVKFLNNAAVAAKAQGNYGLARELLQEAYARDPEDPWIRKNLGQLPDQPGLPSSSKGNSVTGPLRSTKPNSPRREQKTVDEKNRSVE